MKNLSPFWKIVLALFFIWIGLKLVEHVAPRWSGWYVALIAISIIIFYKNQLTAFLAQARGQLKP